MVCSFLNYSVFFPSLPWFRGKIWAPPLLLAPLDWVRASMGKMRRFLRNTVFPPCFLPIGIFAASPLLHTLGMQWDFSCSLRFAAICLNFSELLCANTHADLIVKSQYWDELSLVLFSWSDSVFAWEGAASALGLSQSFQIGLDVLYLRIVANKSISVFICILHASWAWRVLQCGVLILVLLLNFLIQLVLVVFFLVPGLLGVLSWVQDHLSGESQGDGAWWPVLEWPFPEHRWPQN